MDDEASKECAERKQQECVHFYLPSPCCLVLPELIERRPMLLACLLHLLLPRFRRFLGAGLHLNQLSRFRGPAHIALVAPPKPNPLTCVNAVKLGRRRWNGLMLRTTLRQFEPVWRTYDSRANGRLGSQMTSLSTLPLTGRS